MSRFQIIVSILLVSLYFISALPIKKDTSVDHYDQRQNGTENYRINVDGVLFAIAPADALLTSSADFEEFINLLDYDDEFKPTPEPDKKTTTVKAPEGDKTSVKPETEKPPAAKKYGFKKRLTNFILPILRRNRHN